MSRTLRDISREVSSLAHGHSAGARALRDLAGKLAGPQQANLVGVNLAQTYSPEVMLPEDVGWARWPLSTLEITRDVLIFVPVIYTWWKLSDALRAYGSYTGSAPFLLAWQQGFDGRAQRLSTSAVVVAAVVLAIVVLTLVTHFLRSWYDGRIRQHQQELAVLLAEAGVQLRMAGFSRTADVSREELGAMSDSIIRSSLSLREVLEKTGSEIIAAVNASPRSQLQDMFQKWTAAADKLGELGTGLKSTQEVADKLSATQAALGDLTKQIAAETRQLTTQISKETTALTNQVGQQTNDLLGALKNEREATLQAAHAHSKLASNVGASADQLRESLKGLSERAEQFNEMVIQLAVLIEDLRTGEGSVAGAGGGPY